MTTTSIETDDTKLSEISGILADIQAANADLEAKVSNYLSPALPSSSSFRTALLFTGILTGLSGLLIGIAIGTTYIAPTL